MDMEPKVPLEELDPGRDDPWYWGRTYTRIMRAAGPALARRAARARLTVGDVVASWARALVPLALTAAAVASFSLLRSPAPSGTDGVALEEVFLTPADESEAPGALDADEGVPAVFAAEVY